MAKDMCEDYAQRIVVAGRKLAVEMLARDGGTYLAGLDELYRVGLPKAGKRQPGTLSVSFCDFREVPSAEYERNVGITSCHGSQHQVFELNNQGTRILIPALALMRGLFRPKSLLLARMFAPHALDRFCLWHEEDGKTEVLVEPKWWCPSLEASHGNWKDVVRWMFSHESARRMADSVHRNAMAGRLALDLPEAEADIVLTGMDVDGVICVTGVRFASLTPLEAPQHPFNLQTPIQFFDKETLAHKASTQCIELDIPAGQAGLEVTEIEWGALAPILVKPRREALRTHCPRGIFNDVLKKLSSGTSWRNAQLQASDWRLAATTYQRWRVSGAFEKALAVLAASRMNT